MIKKFSSPKIKYELVVESAERADKLREANQNSLTFPFWCNYMTKSEPFLNGTDGALRAPN